MGGGTLLLLFAGQAAPPPAAPTPQAAPAAPPAFVLAGPAVVDDDLAAAIRNLWATDRVQLPRLFVEPPKFGRLKSPQTPPYCQLRIELDGRDLCGTGGAWWDRRRVTIETWGAKAQARDAATAVLAVFNRTTVLVYPSGARHYRWWPDGDVTLTQDDETFQGQDVWKATLGALVTSIRSN